MRKHLFFSSMHYARVFSNKQKNSCCIRKFDQIHINYVNFVYIKYLDLVKPTRIKRITFFSTSHLTFSLFNSLCHNSSFLSFKLNHVNTCSILHCLAAANLADMPPPKAVYIYTLFSQRFRVCILAKNLLF